MAVQTQTAFLDQGAEFSEDRVFRYRLWRTWGPGPKLMVVGLNPSTADETTLDPTLRRCVGYARTWGYDGLMMLNLFAFRATNPKHMLAAEYPHGPDNLRHLREQSELTILHDGAILAAWGATGGHPLFVNRPNSHLPPVRIQGRDMTGARDMAYLYHRYLIQVDISAACLGFTKNLQPRHPLYLRRDSEPIPYTGNGGRLCTDRAS